MGVSSHRIAPSTCPRPVSMFHVKHRRWTRRRVNRRWRAADCSRSPTTPCRTSSFPPAGSRGNRSASMRPPRWRVAAKVHATSHHLHLRGSKRAERLCGALRPHPRPAPPFSANIRPPVRNERHTPRATACRARRRRGRPPHPSRRLLHAPIDLRPGHESPRLRCRVHR